MTAAWLLALPVVAGAACWLAAIADTMHARQKMRAAADNIREQERLRDIARSWPFSVAVGNKPGGGTVPPEDIITRPGKERVRWQRTG